MLSPQMEPSPGNEQVDHRGTSYVVDDAGNWYEHYHGKKKKKDKGPDGFMMGVFENFLEGSYKSTLGSVNALGKAYRRDPKLTAPAAPEKSGETPSGKKMMTYHSEASGFSDWSVADHTHAAKHHLAVSKEYMQSYHGEQERGDPSTAKEYSNSASVHQNMMRAHRSMIQSHRQGLKPAEVSEQHTKADTFMAAAKKSTVDSMHKSSDKKTKVNAWAVCNASVGQDDPEKFESCVMQVKEKHGMKKSAFELFKAKFPAATDADKLKFAAWLAEKFSEKASYGSMDILYDLKYEFQDCVREMKNVDTKTRLLLLTLTTNMQNALMEREEKEREREEKRREAGKMEGESMAYSLDKSITSTGKTVPMRSESINHYLKAVQNFTSDEHKEAASIHGALGVHHTKQMGHHGEQLEEYGSSQMNSPRAKKLESMVDHHDSLASHHSDLGDLHDVMSRTQSSFKPISGQTAAVNKSKDKDKKKKKERAFLRLP